MTLNSKPQSKDYSIPSYLKERSKLTYQKIEAEKVRVAQEAKKAEEAKQLAQTRQVQQVAAGGNCEAYRELVAKYFPANQVSNALLTMQRESGCRPTAVSPTNDHGLFQINNGLAIHGQAIYNPEYNVRLAYQGYFATRGWTPWYAVRGVLW